MYYLNICVQYIIHSRKNITIFSLFQNKYLIIKKIPHCRRKSKNKYQNRRKMSFFRLGTGSSIKQHCCGVKVVLWDRNEIKQTRKFVMVRLDRRMSPLNHDLIKIP